MSCKYCNGNGVWDDDKMKDWYVFENHENPEIAFPTGQYPSVKVDINFCPKCGRNLKNSAPVNENDEYEFPHHLEIPVPMGGTVWSFWTDCCCACYTKKERLSELRCDFQAPCHTYITSVQPVVLGYHNLGMILEQWGIRYFYTKSDAEDAANEMMIKHRTRMKELGYDLDDEGRIIDFESELKDEDE